MNPRSPVTILRRLTHRWRPYPANDDVECNLCGGGKQEVISRRMSFGMGYNTVLCNCGLVFSSPRPSSKAFASFYRDLYPRIYGTEVFRYEATQRGLECVAFLDEVLNLKKERGLFDIGARDFGLLAAALPLGIPVAGCEPVIKADLQQNGITIYAREVEDMAPEVLGRYSVFTLYDTIEHLLDPMGFLKSLSKATPVGAKLFISTNCLDHWYRIPKVKDGFESYYLRLAHTYTFTIKTLNAMLAKSGWRVFKNREAAKGDQWTLAENVREPLPVSASEQPSDVLAYIAAYKAKCG